MPKLWPRGKVPRKVGSVEMAAVGLRLRWSAVQARKPSRRKPPRWPRRAGNLPIIVGELDNRDVLPSPSKIKYSIGDVFQFFLISSHDFVKISNFDEFKNKIASFCEENTCFPLSYLVFTCKSLGWCGVCQIEANLHLTTRTKGNSLFYDYGRQELVWVFGATSMEESSQSVYVGFQNWKQKRFTRDRFYYLWPGIHKTIDVPQSCDWKSLTRTQL